ncbi:MAG: hypothetical protein HYX93_05040, partial [Chloroflexi bacterium]|nr:hypothetical protein [Chloroflexota bacterium]
QALGLVILVQIHSLAWAPAYLIVLAPSYGGSIPVRTAVVAYFFGRRNFGTISGLLQIVDLPGAVLGPVFVGWVFDSLGTYRPGFLVIAALMALGAAALLLAKRPQLQTQPSARETSSPTAPYQGVVGAPPVPPAGGSSGPLS